MKNKKSGIKTPKTAPAHEVSEEFTIKENGSAALNWIEDANKEKLFSIRNFESDAKTYIEIKRVNENGNLAELKLANFVKRIKLLKHQACGALQENIRRSQILGSNQSAPVTNDLNTQPSANLITESNAPPQSPTTQQPSNAQRATTPSTRPYAPRTPNGQIQSNAPNAPYAPHTPNEPHTPNAPSTPSMSNVPYAPIALNASNATNTPNGLDAPPNSSNIPSTPNVPQLPQLLSLPVRVPFRNRAMSMHYSAAEYNAAARLPSARRQSVCDNAPNTNDSFIPQRDPTTNHANMQAPAQIQAQRTYSRTSRPILPKPFYTQGIQQGRPQAIPYMTQIHNSDLAMSAPPPQSIAPPSHSTLKVLTPDDLNSRVYQNLII